MISKEMLSAALKDLAADEIVIPEPKDADFRPTPRMFEIIKEIEKYHKTYVIYDSLFTYIIYLADVDLTIELGINCDIGIKGICLSTTHIPASLFKLILEFNSELTEVLKNFENEKERKMRDGSFVREDDKF